MAAVWNSWDQADSAPAPRVPGTPNGTTRSHHKRAVRNHGVNRCELRVNTLPRHPTPLRLWLSPPSRRGCTADPAQVSVRASPRGSTMKARTGSSIPRSSAGSSGRSDQVSGDRSLATASVTTTSPGAPVLTRRDEQVDERPEVVALPGRGGTDPHRPAGRGQDLVLGGRPADLETDPAGGLRGRRGEEDLVADRLDDPAAGEDGARPGGRLEPGQRQALVAQRRSSGPRPSTPPGRRSRGPPPRSGPRPRRRRQGRDPARTGPPRPGAAPARRRPSPTAPGRRAPP